jgi:hypothetical protein
VETAWTLGDASTVSGGDELKVVLMAGAANGASLPDHVMGVTRRGGQSHATWIYLSNVLWALGFHDRDFGRLSAQQEHQLARALGRVAAHEIVHAVAPELPHTRSGLMAGNLSRPFLIQTSACLVPAERAAVRAGAEGFAAAAQPAPPGGAGGGGPLRAHGRSHLHPPPPLAGSGRTQPGLSAAACG